MKISVGALVGALLIAVPGRAVIASTSDVLGDFVGYTIVASKTIEGFIDDGKEKKDGFEGCSHGRVIIFTDGTAVVCRTYSYTYTYRPKAIILAQQFAYQGKQVTSLKMVVGDQAYDVGAR